MSWRRTSALALACCLLAAPVRAAVAFDAFSSFSCVADLCTSHTVATFAHTVGAGSLRQLVVFVFVACGGASTAPAVSTVTYNGTGLTQYEATTPAAARRGYLYAWPTGSQPTSGANNVVVTLATDLGTACGALATLHGGAISVTGVDQATTWTDTNVASGTTGTTASLTLTGSGASDLGVEAVCSGDAIASTTETSRWSANELNSSCGSNGGATAAAADTSFSWTITSDSWILLGGSFKADTGGAAALVRSHLVGVGP